MENVTIVIPARKGSKGFPGKNRHLFDYVTSQIPHEFKRHVIFTSDDDANIHKLFNDLDINKKFYSIENISHSNIKNKLKASNLGIFYLNPLKQ